MRSSLTEPTDWWRLLAGVLCGYVITVAGCAGPQRTIEEARGAFASGQADRALQSLQTLAERRGRFSDPAALDLAMIELAAGDSQAAERRLRQLRDRFDQTPELAVAHEAAALVSDDTLRRYEPAGYEQVMIRAMLAVCSLAGDAIDAESYTLQAMNKQAELSQKAQERGLLSADAEFQPIAVAPYLRGVVREATHHDYDDAARAYQLVSHVQPDFLPVQQDLLRAGSGVHSQPGHGVLYVLACVGRGPQLEETTAPTTSASLTLASAMLASQQSSQSRKSGRSPPVLPNIASVKVPRVVIPPSRATAVTARVDGELLGATQTLTDVGQLAQRQLELEMPWTIARAVVRRATKEATVASARNGLGISGTAGSLFQFAAATAWSASEHADTRCWGLLPREIQVLRAELPAGSHTVELTPVGPNGAPIGPARSFSASIEDGRNYYVVAIAPDSALYLAKQR